MIHESCRSRYAENCYKSCCTVNFVYTLCTTFCHYKMASSAVRKLPQYLKEIRIHLCQRSPSSQGVRDWVEKYYVDLKKQNPSFPIRVRECSGIQPKMYARYDFGKETCADLGNMNGQQVNETLYKFADSKP
ncbi:NADH dehydrogenase [ubiquinone] 1 alpha subcomplex subunit 2-like [Anneissia japonica]|uniref:NADH dehydrogenase [ubiquinone] 1 alpha subcomplex subunit 2-like n=1 Tax=Anneissia japonica TaxID=1529436 RepID=UPI0014256BEB|nr:NADH dehydrogenase [ubiquinone] 1 alpha subcomplex subunit 2-like [Anneissia japonica]XP_033127129.1 NADH dehydrogenase [ubiquinone] 1 alpha subcomplex subunit 2-like [Anneissia japonica]